MMLPARGRENEQKEEKEGGRRGGGGEKGHIVDHARSKCKCALRVMANVSNAYAVLRRRPPDGVSSWGPDERRAPAPA